jgi:hypothetical protein
MGIVDCRSSIAKTVLPENILQLFGLKIENRQSKLCLGRLLLLEHLGLRCVLLFEPTHVG